MVFLWMKSVAPHLLAFYLDLHYLKSGHRFLREKKLCAVCLYSRHLLKCPLTYFSDYLNTPGRLQSKTLLLSTNVDQKLVETEFLIAICPLTGNKWQLKTLFIVIFDQRPLIKSVLDCCLPCVLKH